MHIVGSLAEPSYDLRPAAIKCSWSCAPAAEWGSFFSTVLATCTFPETNIAPENRPSQKDTSIPTIHFWVLCLLQGGSLVKCGEIGKFQQLLLLHLQ